jgi:hypothetical protein
MRAEARTLPRERGIAIARMILGDDAPEADVAELAEWARTTAATLPPLTAEQRDVIAVLLRPERG